MPKQNDAKDQQLLSNKNFKEINHKFSNPLKNDSINRQEYISFRKKRLKNDDCSVLKCPKCGKSFNRNWLLKGHLRTHSRIYSF